MIEIPLTRGYVAMVDDVDAHLAAHKWHAVVCGGGTKVYAVRRGDGPRSRIKMHRDIMMPPDDLHVDHIDGNGINNQRANLRIATNRQNQYNKPSNLGAGVFRYWDGQDRWRAQIWHEGKKVSVGVFMTKEDAHAAYAFCAYYLREGFAPIERPPDFDMAKLGPSMQARLAALLTAIVIAPSRRHSERGTVNEPS